VASAPTGENFIVQAVRIPAITALTSEDGLFWSPVNSLLVTQ
jgi:hypothetical protein